MTLWIDLDRKAPASARRRRVPLVAVVALTAGVLGGLVASLARAAEPAVTHEVRFTVVGPAKVEYAALVTPGRVEQVASVVPHTVTTGTTAVLTIRSGPQLATCQIIVDGMIVNESHGGAGNSATCIWTIGR